VQVIDDYLVDYFSWFYKSHMKNSILIVMGDHGMNFGSYRETQLGRIEASMPFFSIAFPEYLKVKYPEMEKRMTLNVDRMASWYDVYDTLMDILTARYDQPRKSWSKTGVSLFHPLPNRTCEEASIPADFCPCEIAVNLSLTSDQTTEVAKSMVGYMNGLVKDYPQCAELKLLAVHSALKILPNSATAKPKGFQNVFRLVIEVFPGHGFLEGTMVSHAWSGLQPVGRILRLDTFGNASDCMPIRDLRHYCNCIT